MDGFAAVRALARAKHAQMLEHTGSETCATALLLAARSVEKMTVQVLSKSHPLLGDGEGTLRRRTRMIAVCAEASPELQAFYEAHEFGHLWIETVADPVHVSTGIDPGIPEEPSPLGIHRVEAYSAQELRERYANVFAREFLLPTDTARRLFINEGKNASTIATELGLPLSLVHQQLAVSLLLPVPVGKQKGNESPRPGLDPSQQAAAELRSCPALVEASPGTGKTRTLIARIEYLLSQGVTPSSILALTFSNKAAREIKDRVAKAAPAAAAEIWAGTFHAFGLEIVRKYADLLELQEPVRLVDQADALALIEQELPCLGLDHYLRLHEPLLELRHILKAISRAKDEVFSPAEYEAAARRMGQAARTEEDALKAEKALEVARVYAHYEDLLRQKGVVDFSDLINRPIEFLQTHPDELADYRAQFQHVLVDEYQDVNRASAILLKLLAGEGQHLWVVGDARQSIYRFRGAAPTNMQKFETDFPGARRVPLGVNYRSPEQIVRAFDTFSRTMSAAGGHGGTMLKAHRGLGAEPIAFNLASDLDAEISGIATVIEAKRKQDYAYRDQAVLCRSHGSLEEIAVGLERAGVPILYLGDLFERPEVRDLLAILSFTSEPDRGGLYRIAVMPEYAIPLEDVRAFLAFATAHNLTPLAAMSRLDEANDMSGAGRTALAHVREDIGEVQFKTGPATLLCRLLFDRGVLLRRYLAGDDAAVQQKRLAVHQFLQFAIENDFAPDGDPKKTLLDWVRRLEVFGDERALRELPTAVEGIDAVRLMTVHASKGLEFPIVHLPILGKGKFPLQYQGNRCPPPDGMLLVSDTASHEEEEECLFYVALSRAEDHLSLSRALRYSEKPRSNPSPALECVQAHLGRSITGVPTWTGRTGQQGAYGVLPSLAVRALGARVVADVDPSSPAIILGDVEIGDVPGVVLRATFDGWSGGVVPARSSARLAERGDFTPAGVLAGALAVSEVFQHLRHSHALAGRRAIGLSLWRPERDWRDRDCNDPPLERLPASAWLVGLGNLGQAYLWTLGLLPYGESPRLTLVLQDFDILAPSNLSTSLLTAATQIGVRKSRAMSKWAEVHGFETVIIERPFAADFHVAAMEPTVALIGVDNPLARRQVEDVGFERVIEAGLGKGPQDFLGFNTHSFPASRPARTCWSDDAAVEASLNQPAYRALMETTGDRCGTLQLAGRTIGAPFVGAVAGALVVSELVRLTVGAHRYEYLSGHLRGLDGQTIISGDPWPISNPGSVPRSDWL